MTRYREGGRRMISMRFDPDLLDALEKLGAKLKRNRTELLEDAAAMLLKSHGVEAKPTHVTPKRRSPRRQPPTKGRP